MLFDSCLRTALLRYVGSQNGLATLVLNVENTNVIYYFLSLTFSLAITGMFQAKNMI